MDNKETIKKFITNIKEGKNDEARKNVDAILYSLAGNAVKEMKKQTAQNLFNKK